jgi:integrase/recombinase XerD
MRQNFTVKAILRPENEKKDGTCPINYKVRIGGKEVKLPSGEFIEKANWNSRDGLIKGSKSSVVNCCLESQVSKIKDFIREQMSLGNKVTIDMVRNFNSNKPKVDDFATIYDEFCKRKFLEICSGTQNHYLLLKRRVLEFKPNLKVQDIDLIFIEKFDTFLRNKSVITDAGLFNRHKNFKTFIRYAIKQKLITENPYEDFKSPKCKQKFGYITVEELRTIRGLNLIEHKNQRGLRLTIDMFLFSCYTGLRCSDVKNLKWSNVINMRSLAFVTQKNKKKSNVPLSKLAKLILMKYKGNKAENIFPNRTNACLNRNLKQIAKKCEIEKIVTYHMARHTFATILADSNVNPYHIAQMMSHSDMKQTMTYVNASVNSLENSIANIDAFN